MRTASIRVLDIALQAVTIGLIAVLACIVLAGVAFRYSGNSLIWYDEVAVVILAWITFTGATLGVLRNAHLGFSGLLYGAPPAARISLFWFNEALFLATFAVAAWAGWVILGIFDGETMTTLRFVPRAAIQFIVPASAGLMILARLLTIPERLAAVLAGKDPDSEEILHEIARAETELGIRKEGAA